MLNKNFIPSKSDWDHDRTKELNDTLHTFLILNMENTSSPSNDDFIAQALRKRDRDHLHCCSTLSKVQHSYGTNACLPMWLQVKNSLGLGH